MANSEFGAEHSQDDEIVGPAPTGDDSPGEYESSDQSGGGALVATVAAKVAARRRTRETGWANARDSIVPGSRARAVPARKPGKYRGSWLRAAPTP